ncbi:MAG: hypothetical protein KY476_16280 [Planctomycetes bacterium]|nr:hypothetical protein [Planctomycetota bacterium]
MWMMSVGTMLAAAIGVAAGQDAVQRITSEDARVGELPDGWSAAKTGEGPGSVWKVVEDASAPKGAKVLAQTSSDGPRLLFNLCVADELSFRDIDRCACW